LLKQSDTVAENLFERSAHATWLSAPPDGVLVDCSLAAVELIGVENKRQWWRDHDGQTSCFWNEP
jgi:hypothetical protein